MPVKKVRGGWTPDGGKTVVRTRAQALRVLRAIHANKARKGR